MRESAWINFDDHAIKFTEACRRIDQLRPSPVFRAAAGD
jgi:hypothetical protein